MSGRFFKCVNLQNVDIFFISSKLHCASLIFSIHRHDLDDRLRLLLVQYDCQNSGCRCFRLTLPRHFQMRQTSKPPRIKKSLLITVCRSRRTNESDLCRHDCHTVSCMRPCVLFPACFTNPLAPETVDLVTHRDRGSEESARTPHHSHTVFTLSALQFSSQVVARKSTSRAVVYINQLITSRLSLL